MQSGNEEAVKAGLYFIKNDWQNLRNCYPHIDPRKDPRVDDYDLHVHVPFAPHAPAVRASHLCHACCSPIPGMVAG